MSQDDQAGTGGNWRVQLGEMRTVAALRGGGPDASTVARMSDRALRAALFNPDHSEAGRAAAAAEMQARGLTADPWRIRVPGFITRRDLEKHGDRIFFGPGRAWRTWSGWIFFAIVAALLVSVFWLQHEADRWTRDFIEQSVACEYHDNCANAPGSAGQAELAIAGAVSPSSSASPTDPSPPDMRPLRERMSEAEFRGMMSRIKGPWWLVDNDTVDTIAAPVAVAVLVPLLIWFFASILRRKPARILLLRKFNERHVSTPLERMLAQELRPYGHVASLSDKHIKRDAFGWLSTALLSLSNPLALIWFVVATPIRFIFRLFDRSAMGPAVVLNARDYCNLAKRLRDRIGLNGQVALTSKEAFLVRTSDAWWQMVVRLFMDSSDAIVVDLSQVAAGTAWELDVIGQEQAQARCVFVSVWGKAEEAEAILRARGFDNPCFHYAPDGEMQRRSQFRAAMLAAMRATHGAA